MSTLLFETEVCEIFISHKRYFSSLSPDPICLLPILLIVADTLIAPALIMTWTKLKYNIL